MGLSECEAVLFTACACVCLTSCVFLVQDCVRMCERGRASRSSVYIHPREPLSYPHTCIHTVQLDVACRAHCDDDQQSGAWISSCACSSHCACASLPVRPYARLKHGVLGIYRLFVRVRVHHTYAETPCTRAAVTQAPAYPCAQAGVLLERFMTRFQAMAALAPVINGIGGNLGAVQASRISTSLHAQSRCVPGPSTVYMDTCPVLGSLQRSFGLGRTHTHTHTHTRTHTRTHARTSPPPPPRIGFRSLRMMSNRHASSTGITIHGQESSCSCSSCPFPCSSWLSSTDSTLGTSRSRRCSSRRTSSPPCSRCASECCRFMRALSCACIRLHHSGCIPEEGACYPL